MDPRARLQGWMEQALARGHGPPRPARSVVEDFCALAWPDYRCSRDLEILFRCFGPAFSEDPSATLVLIHDPATDPDPSDISQVLERTWARVAGADAPLRVELFGDPGGWPVWVELVNAVPHVLTLPSSLQGERSVLRSLTRGGITRSDALRLAMMEHQSQRRATQWRTETAASSGGWPLGPMWDPPEAPRWSPSAHLAAHDFGEGLILDYGPGPLRRTAGFRSGRLVTLEPLASEFRCRLWWSDLQQAGEVVEASLETPPPHLLGAASVVILGDLLQRVSLPDTVLAAARQCLAPNGTLLVSPEPGAGRYRGGSIAAAQSHPC